MFPSDIPGRTKIRRIDYSDGPIRRRKGGIRVNDKQDKKLLRHLGGIDAFCIASGAMISSGLFVLPGLIYAKVGPAVILAYILAGILALPALFAKAELATAMPKAGGSYFFIERSMGSLAGTIGGFASWLSLSLKSSFALVGIGAFATLLFPSMTEWQIRLIGIGCCILFTVINIISVKFTGKAQVLLVFVLIGLLTLYIFRGAASLDVHKYTPFMPSGYFSLFGAAGMVFVSFGGVTKIASVAEEIRDPAKNIPLGMISAFCVIMLIYGLSVFVTVGLLDGHELSHSLTPLSTGGHTLFGAAGSAIMAIAAILSFITTANAGILSASRFPMAMSRDQLLPRFFATVNRRFKTPHVSIMLTGAFMVIAVALLNLENLVEVASAMMIALFMFVILACITMRESRILNYKPTFVSPFYPWLHIAGLICYGFILFQMGAAPLIAVAAFILASVLWHIVYVRGIATRKSALVHIVERLTAKEMVSDSLGRELRDILGERDAIVEDRFDELVKSCEIIDFGKQFTLEEFFELAAQGLSARLNVDAEQLIDSLLSREKESSTVLRPGLAIPHVTIEGENKFELLIARCEAGIKFTEDMPPVYAVFILIGSRDQRNFHLRALAAVAQIVQDPNFDKDWLRAKSTNELRDIVLLSKRHRKRS